MKSCLLLIFAVTLPHCRSEPIQYDIPTVPKDNSSIEQSERFPPLTGWEAKALAAFEKLAALKVPFTDIPVPMHLILGAALSKDFSMGETGFALATIESLRRLITHLDKADPKNPRLKRLMVYLKDLRDNHPLKFVFAMSTLPFLGAAPRLLSNDKNIRSFMDSLRSTKL